MGMLKQSLQSGKRVIYQTMKFVVLISLYVFILNDCITYFTIYYSAALNISSEIICLLRLKRVEVCVQKSSRM
jgi:hypothetical protein